MFTRIDHFQNEIKTSPVWHFHLYSFSFSTGRSNRIYDYMYHLIVEYAELLDFKPVRPVSALEECVESLYCFADQNQAQFLARSAASPSQTPPCKLPAQAANRKIDKMIEEKKKIIDSTQLLM
ncbi:putative glycosyl transferase CAP10 domain-containing protein [Helianthus anomalus]